jgi:hypothetical protein
VQDGTCSSSFLMFLNELEHEGVITLQHGDAPPRLKGATPQPLPGDELPARRPGLVWQGLALRATLIGGSER